MRQRDIVGKWLDGTGRDADIIISSRIRIARNIKYHKFLSKTDEKEQQEIIEGVKNAIDKIGIPGMFKKADDLTPLEMQFLLERHMVSPDFVQSNVKRAVYVSSEETLSIMVNEEDHIRIQVIGSGLSVKETFKEAEKVDSSLNKFIPFAYDEEYGFLTACPTNVGTGIRVSILVHLPGIVLTEEIEKVLRSIYQLGLVVRGVYGEGTETKGYLFQISNQQTLGKSEEEIISIIENIGREVVEYERKARDFLFTKTKYAIEDKIYRSLGILKYARRITSEEALNLLSTLRMGINIIPELSIDRLNRLMIITRPANIQIFVGKALSEEERDVKRAELLRKELSFIASTE